jgi:hypothetical protein
MNITLHIVLCAVLALIAVGVALYKKWLEDHDDHYIHLHNDAVDTRIITTQATMAKRIEGLEKATRYLTIAVIVYAVFIGGLAAYMAWTASAG